MKTVWSGPRHEHVLGLQVTDEAAKAALKEMEEDWTEFEGRLSGQAPSKAPAQPPLSQTQTPGRVSALLSHKQLCAPQCCVPL